MYEYVFIMYMPDLVEVRKGPSRSSSDPSELELELVVSHHVGVTEPGS